jgi:hypothetical protein
VDYSSSEQACGFQVLEAPEPKGHTSNKYYKGFTILKKVDAQFILDDPEFDWISGVLRLDNEVLIGLPPDNYETINHPEDFMDLVDEGTYKSMDEDQNRYISGPSCKKMWYLLKFPTLPDAETSNSFKRSVKEIALPEDEDSETKVPMEYFPVATSHSQHPQTQSDYAAFTVVCLDKRPGKRGNVGKPKLGPAAKQMFMRVYNARALANAQAAQQDQEKPYPNLPEILEEVFLRGRFD